MSELHICRDCSVSHFDNCEMCFGFGVYRGKPRLDNYVIIEDILPVRAGDAMEGTAPANAEPCPLCKSTPAGIPT